MFLETQANLLAWRFLDVNINVNKCATKFFLTDKISEYRNGRYTSHTRALIQEGDIYSCKSIYVPTWRHKPR